MIPKKIHYCWFGGKEMGPQEKAYLKNWAYYCPDYEIKRWDETNFPIEDACDYVKEAYELKEWAFVSDVARLHALVNEGGIYLDTDMELIHSLDSLLVLPAFFGFEIETKISTGIIGSEPNHPLITEFYHDYDDRHFVRAEKTEDVETNVIRITKILQEYGLKLNNTRQVVRDAVIFPRDVFSPKDYTTREVNLTENTLAIHQFSGSWL
jgi:mannosyltransferase OCH1-like enzyme